MSGQTTIEFAERRTFTSKGNYLPKAFYDFRQSKILKNLEYIFGTRNFFRMFFPNFKILEHEGVDWENYISNSTEL